MCVPPLPQSPNPHWRRRSADIGGLHLATENAGGQGWAYNSGQLQTMWAELLSDMYTQTCNSVNEHNPESIPADLPADTRSHLIDSLDSWNFEPHKLPDEEVIACTLILFEVLFRIEGMLERIPISLKQISSFVHHLRRIYRLENSYHNFEHALDVLQATHSYLCATKMVPPVSILHQPGLMWKSKRRHDSGPPITSLGVLEIFGLYIAAIGHDVGHPGFTNLFMTNAEAPLSLVFDKSALENMHCQLLLRVMRQHGLEVLLDHPKDGDHFRKLLYCTVMATDMSVHNEFMTDFEKLISGESGTRCQRQTLICQAIMKCADISNPSRPFQVSEHWAIALGQEWTSQALLERSLSLKETVKVSYAPLTVAASQVFFSTAFAKPLLDLVVRAVPELRPYANQCASNLERWTKRKTQLQASSTDVLTSSLPPAILSDHQHDYLSAFPLTLPASHRPTLSEDKSLFQLSASSSSSGSSPASPSESVSSSLFSPTSDSSLTNQPPSSSRTSSSTHNDPFSQQYNDHNGIRAAGKLSIPKVKRINRNSWCPISTTSVYSPSPPPSQSTDVSTNSQLTPPTLLASPHTTPPSVRLLVSTSAKQMSSSADETIVVARPKKHDAAPS